jgi:hypothetical protein
MKKTFPSARIVFFSDDKDSISRITAIGIETHFCEIPSDLLERQDSHFKNHAKFRSGFWFLTYARLLLLQDIMKNLELSSALQVEGDVILFPNFPYETLSTIKNIAYPLTDPSKGVASTLWLGSLEAAENLRKYILEVLEFNPFLSDMDILGSYWKDHPSSVTILPSSANERQYFAQNATDDDIQILTKNHEIFYGIFDGNTIGQYLTGLDPANDWGLRKVFVDQVSHKINPKAMNFLFKNRVLELITGKNLRIPIYSLHIHSKDMRALNYDLQEEYFSKRLKQNRGQIVTEFVWKKFVSSMVDSFSTTLRRLHQKISPQL